MRAIILSIGDELVLGQTVDTNSAWLSQQLAAVGCDVLRHVTVADDQKAIEQSIRAAVSDAQVLLVTGGIGPTEDDLTRQALAAVMGVELEMNDQWLAHLEAFFRKIGRPMSPLNRIQGMIPRGGTMIANAAGTAAGIRASIPSSVSGSADSSLCEVFVMPGVPKEMKRMFELEVLPIIRAVSAGAVILSRTLHTFGSGESAVAEKLGDLMRRDRNPSVGTTVSGGVVSLRINSRFSSLDEAVTRLDQTAELCRQALGDLIYGQDEESLAGIVAQLLKASGKTVTTAESCTGGLLAKMLTDVAGSSAYFKQGWVTYSNEAKSNLLDVDPSHIKGHGAVSGAVVREMATGALRRAGADYALSISGIAGPDGGTPEKPVGTVCIGVAFPDPHQPGAIKAHARTFVFSGDREMIRDRSAKMALTMLRFHLLAKPFPF